LIIEFVLDPDSQWTVAVLTHPAAKIITDRVVYQIAILS